MAASTSSADSPPDVCECDVIAPADHLVIETMLKPARLADYTILFASGRMVLAYVATDPKSSALQVSGLFNPPTSVPEVSGRWYDVLTAPGVRISGAHPFMDPGGYRTHMIFELAQAYYKVPGLYNALLQHYQVNVADPSETAPALGKDFNFQFTYEHNATNAAKRDASYRYARLPEEIDLSSTKEDHYASARHDSRARHSRKQRLRHDSCQRCGVGSDDPDEEPQSRQRDRVCE